MRAATSGGKVLGISAMAAVLVGLAAAAEPSRTIDLGGLTVKTPESWKSITPSNRMRKAQLQVQPLKGDEYPAEMIVSVFPGGAGSVEDNIKRWHGMFKDADGNPPKIESRTIKGKNVEVAVVETAGHYTPSRFPGLAAEPERDGARLLGAIVVTERFGYFFRMIGPDKTMSSIRPAFEEMVKSMEVDESN